jgi:hypothetical protein
MEMEATMADDDFVNRTVQLAVSDVERNLIQASRDYEDAVRDGDEISGADAFRRYAENKKIFDEMTGGGSQQQQSGQLSAAQKSFLSRRAAGGDDLTPQRWADYARAHDKAVAAGLQPDTDAYFRSIEFYVDHPGDGRQPPLSQSEAARISGVDEQTYAAGAARLQALKRAGHYQD